MELECGSGGEGWLPVERLVGDPDVLRDRVRGGRATLSALAGLPVDEVEERVAASVVMLGLAARLAAPAVAVAAACGAVLPVGRLLWRDGPPGPVPLLLPTDVAPEGSLGAVLVDGVLTRLVATTREIAPLAPSLLWGNAASGIAGAAAALARARPALHERAHAVADELLAHPSLAGSGSFDARRGFRRRTCCLYYRLPGGGTCGDCPLPG